ncbi:MAG: hypothetical protein K0Q73_7527 [Paenibacillus sp.]|nr:hypothetical protein [Paenibacillus sp.]
MFRHDDDFFKELEADPFPAKGFTPSLKKQIQREMNWKKSPPKFSLKYVTTAGFMLVILLVSMWFSPLLKDTNEAETTKADLLISKPYTEQAKAIKSVLLVGLRTDSAREPDASSYRSLMIAESGNRMKTVAEGSGILIPYGQEFWEIHPIDRKNEVGMTRTLQALPAEQASNPTVIQPTINKPSLEKAVYYEKLLFASNNYVSVSVKDETRNEASSSQGESVWTQNIKQMAEGYGPIKSHVSLQELFGNAAIGENWAPVRSKGQWHTQIAEKTLQGGSNAAPQQQELPLTLPQSVVSHDQLVCTWDEVRRVQPNAIDAVSSPDQDMIAILTKTNIYIYPYSDQIGEGPLLSIGLNPNESLVMVQWATEKYAEKWIEKGKQYLVD